MLLLFPGVLRLEASVADKASHFCPFIHRCPICHLYFHMFAAFISLMYVHVLIFSCKVPIPPLSCHSRLISHCLEEVFSCHTPHLFPKSWLCANSFCIGFSPWWLLPSGCYPVSVAFLPSWYQCSADPSPLHISCGFLLCFVCPLLIFVLLPISYSKVSAVWTQLGYTAKLKWVMHWE